MKPALWPPYRAAVADGAGGARATGVRWYLKYCVLARNTSPISGLRSSSSEAYVLERETLVMDFVIWLLMAYSLVACTRTCRFAVPSHVRCA